MQKEGIILQIEDDTAYVNVKPAHKGGCGSCGKCKVKKDEFVIEVDLPDFPVDSGDRVLLEMEDSSVYSVGLFLYVVPPLFMIMGYLIAQFFGAKEGLGIFISFLFLIAAFYLIRYFDTSRGEKLIKKNMKIIKRI
ncbi:SoxR reducing system RseC family protein [Ilyobacter polytropus]|uniref:Positive regulator of sigma E, RseC/MucC n=1 Tax=Ilyobacter polytropus (strain ATCC 51220 / DSM 2926 / LMG 16218 / CuHBu1) TaxID=572544 RepID=E3HBX9_ILYPC|nr:SoxR reducing system RseC family protein [Ilyobacter polytropus]ADO84305.1 positive regulator of sigma E, RseC/MucC [Ilyobacter polytropus DSM 2926]